MERVPSTGTSVREELRSFNFLLWMSSPTSLYDWDVMKAEQLGTQSPLSGGWGG